MIKISAVCSICHSSISIFDISIGSQIRIKSKIACCGVEVIIVGAQRLEEIFGHWDENDLPIKGQKNQRPEYIEYQKKHQKKKVPYHKKNYKVNINFIQLTEEDARIKRAIIQGIIRKSNIYHKGGQTE